MPIFIEQPKRSDGTPIVSARTLTFGQSKFQRGDGVTQMAVNGGSTVAEDVWDGDGSYWTRSGVGMVTKESAHSGTNGLDTGISELNDRCRFDYGSDRDLESSFDSVSFWMEPQAYPEGSNLRVRWKKSGGGTAVGDWVCVSDYVTDFDPGVWKRVTIPLSDFNLGGTSAGRLIISMRGAASQHFYFDDVEMLNSGSDGPYIYKVKPDLDSRYHVGQIVLVIESESTGWDGSSFADIADGIENGLLLRHRRPKDGGVLWSTVLRNNSDLFGSFVPAYDFTFSGGTLMITFVLHPRKADIVIDGSKSEKIEWIVRDDLGSLSNVRAYVQYGVEHLPQSYDIWRNETTSVYDSVLVNGCHYQVDETVTVVDGLDVAKDLSYQVDETVTVVDGLEVV